VKYLLDTNVLSEIRKANGDSKVKAFIDAIALEDLFISILSMGEIAFGVEKLPQGKKKNEFLIWLNRQLPAWFENRIVPLDRDVMFEWGRIRARAKRTLPVVDTLLAASALTYRLVILTRNTCDFKGIGDLSLLNPWD
jgi:predicted nucleic acid-binding protein